MAGGPAFDTDETAGVPLLHVLTLLILFALAACGPAAPERKWQQSAHGSMSAAWSPDGAHGFIGSLKHGGSLWQSRDGERLYDWNHREGEFSAIRAAAFSADGQFVATSAGNEMVIWSVADGESVRHWTAPSRILSLALSEDGSFAFLGLESREAVMFYTFAGGLVGRLPHSAPVQSVAMDDAAKTAVSTDGSRVIVWSLEAGAARAAWEVSAPVDFVVIAPDGSQVVSSADLGPVTLSTLHDDQPPTHETLYTRNPGLSTGRFAKGGTELLLGTAREGVILWDLTTMEPRQEWRVPKAGQWNKAAVLSVAFGAGGQYFAAVSSGHSYEFAVN